MRTGVTSGPGRYTLEPMATGTVSIERGAQGRLQARVEVFGLTPGSSHQVSIDGPLGHLVRFPTLTASAAGQANLTLTSVGSAGTLPPASRFVIRLGNGGSNPVATEPIAETDGVYPGSALTLHAVVAEGGSLVRPAGGATLVYNTAARSLTITVTAYGLTPGRTPRISTWAAARTRVRSST